jgi:hypothetical protein
MNGLVSLFIEAANGNMAFTRILDTGLAQADESSDGAMGTLRTEHIWESDFPEIRWPASVAPPLRKITFLWQDSL